MERKLASIQKVLEISPIKDADKIELAKVLGWQCVVKKSENLKVGELAIYFEIDSMLDENNPSFDFLKKDGKIKKLKTVTLKKQLSQGLLLPLMILNNTGRVFLSNGNYFWSNAKEEVANDESIQLVEGLDLTSILNIKKFEEDIPAQLTGKVKGSFPSFCSRTDESRIQNFPEIISECIGEEMIGCTKLDGTSSTFYLKDDEFGVCSRNLNLLETEGNTYWKMARHYDIENRMKVFRELSISNGFAVGRNFSISGEIIGEGIQGNPLGIKGQELRLFSFYDIDSSRYCSHMTLKHFCEWSDLPMVPIAAIMKFDENVTVNSLLKFSNDRNYPNGSPAEGVVWRPMHREIYSEILKGRLSFKAISNRFLLSLKD